MVAVSVVIPVFNNADSIKQSVECVLDHLRKFLDVTPEVVLVDDGSTDHSWAMCAELASLHPETVRAVRLSRNFGQVSALSAGLARASGDAVVVMSADLQDPIELISEMVRAWESGTDVVIAHRSSRHDDLMSRVFSRIAYRVAKTGNDQMPEGGFDYFLMSRRAVDVLNSYASRHRFLQGDVLWMGFPTLFIPYERQARVHGKSGWTLRKKAKYFTDLVLDSSYAPIQVMSRLGLLVAAAGLIYALVIVIAYLVNETPFPGWAPIMVTLLIIGGTLMMMLGISAEYLWRIYDEVKSKPLFVVQEEVGNSPLKDGQEFL